MTLLRRIMLIMITVWSVFNLFFLIGSAPLNVVYFGIFFTVQLVDTAVAINKAAGAFAFASGMLGYYTVANLMCQEALGFTFPMGDTSRFFKKKIA
jgi:hypothetical protein